MGMAKATDAETDADAGAETERDADMIMDSVKDACTRTNAIAAWGKFAAAGTVAGSVLVTGQNKDTGSVTWIKDVLL